MKKMLLGTALALGLTMTSCLGPNNAFNNLNHWNTKVTDSKWGNEGIFLVLTIIPVYTLFYWGDILIFNSIEFWGGENPIDVVPLLIERIRLDESIRVRRHAVAMLASQHAHPDLEGFFQELLDTETDAKLHKHAGIGLMMCRRPDLTVPEAARLAARQIRRGEGQPGTG